MIDFFVAGGYNLFCYDITCRNLFDNAQCRLVGSLMHSDSTAELLQYPICATGDKQSHRTDISIIGYGFDIAPCSFLYICHPPVLAILFLSCILYL